MKYKTTTRPLAKQTKISLLCLCLKAGDPEGCKIPDENIVITIEEYKNYQFIFHTDVTIIKWLT